jgi:hypothetical protein
VSIIERAARHAARRLQLGLPLGTVNQPAALAVMYGGTDKGTHGYMPHYARHLGPRRLHRNTVWEIGVGGYDSRHPGGSLAIWRDFLIRSVIIGIDIYDKDIAWGRRVKFVRADQSAPGDLDAALALHGVPNIVIDDGSHVGEHIHATFSHLWPLLPPGSLYVIEDLCTSYAAQFGGSHPPPPSSAIGLVRQLVSDIQADDAGFRMDPALLGAPPDASAPAVAAIHLYPGIAFIEKAG